MKKSFTLLLAICLLSSLHSFAQDKSERPSPPMTASASVHGAMVTIDYSAPAVKGRTIWGDLVPYGKVWRTGANEATTITFDADVMINDTKIPAGKYGLFTIPGEKEWTVIINSVWDQWGAYNYDSSKDVLRFNVESKKAPEMTERMTINITEKGKVSLMWENTMVSFMIKK